MTKDEHCTENIPKRVKELHLVLTYHWFDEIEKGKKNIEYRDCSPYWRKRIFDNDPNIVVFHRGYSKNIMVFSIKSKLVSGQGIIEIRLGKRLFDDYAKNKQLSLMVM